MVVFPGEQVVKLSEVVDLDFEVEFPVPVRFVGNVDFVKGLIVEHALHFGATNCKTCILDEFGNRFAFVDGFLVGFSVDPFCDHELFGVIAGVVDDADAFELVVLTEDDPSDLVFGTEVMHGHVKFVEHV